jgi:uncharacterized membrane protein required for colicin V production
MGLLSLRVLQGLLVLMMAGLAIAGFAAELPTPAVESAPAVSTEADKPKPAGPSETKDSPGSSPKQQDEKAQQDRDTAEARTVKRWAQIGVIAAAMLILAVVSAALYRYITALRDKLAELATSDEHSRKLFLQMGLGVPDGTIRSALAVLIVLGALLALVAAIGKDELGFTIPETLTGVFGTILGFYFGRAGSVEASQATAVVVNAAQMTSQASQQIAESKEKTAMAEASAQAAVKTASATRLKAVVARIGPIEQAMESIIAFAPQSLLGGSVTKWQQLRETLTVAASAGTLDQLETALDQLGKQGPVATLLQQVSPALAPMAQPGQSPGAAARMLIELTLTLAPEVAQRWALRVLGLPFRPEVIDPVIDDAYAADLIKSSVVASRILENLQASLGPVAMSATHLVKLVLTDDALATLTETLAGVAAEDLAAMVEQLQKHALEQQLEHDVPTDRAAPFGGLGTLLEAVDRVRSTQEGMQALDIVLGIVRRARSVGVPIADLLSPAH